MAVLEDVYKYFKGPSYYHMYALVYMDGNDKKDALGIASRQYKNKRSAEIWKDHITTSICHAISHPDHSAALREVNRIYNNMIQHGE